MKLAALTKARRALAGKEGRELTADEKTRIDEACKEYRDLKPPQAEQGGAEETCTECGFTGPSVLFDNGICGGCRNCA